MSLNSDKNNIIENRYISNYYDEIGAKSNIYIGDCVRELAEQLKAQNKLLLNLVSINKNLEKIANKNFIQIGDLKTTINNTGSYLQKDNIEKQLNNIICKQNKDGYVDRNIILD